VIRILPGLNIEDDDIREGLARLDRIALTLGSGADIASRHQAVT
jgi:acetylornithine/succinyldiaminopimelate/putrescine aminotransferase